MVLGLGDRAGGGEGGGVGGGGGELKLDNEWLRRKIMTSYIYVVDTSGSQKVILSLFLLKNEPLKKQVVYPQN